MAIYRAPGPMNGYRHFVYTSVVLYDGRTKGFLGRQTAFNGNFDMKYGHATYDGLVASLDKTIPAMREAFDAQIPRIVDIISANRTEN